MAYKKYKNTAILNDDNVIQKDVPKTTQVLELPNSDYINNGLNLPEIRGYNLKSVTIVKGRNTVIEIFK